MTSLWDRLKGALKGGGDAEEVPLEGVIPVKDIPPEIMEEMDAEDEERRSFEATLDEAENDLEFDPKADPIEALKAQKKELREVLKKLDKENQAAQAAQVVGSIGSRGRAKPQVEAATAQALQSGALIDGNAKSVGFGTPFGTPTPAQTKPGVASVVQEMAEDSDVPAHILSTMAEQMFQMMTLPESEDDYPMGDPKKPHGEPAVKVDWAKERDPDEEFQTVIPAEALQEAAEIMHPEPNAVENALAASVMESRENDRKLKSGEGKLDNKEFLNLVGAVMDSIDLGDPMPNMDNPHGACAVSSSPETDEKGVSKDVTSEETAEDGPLTDPLPQFLRPEVALRKLPEDDPSRAPLDFIRKVIELLRDVFPEVKDKYWILNEVQAQDTHLVTAVVRINATRDVVIGITPGKSECFIRTEDADTILEHTWLNNANWDDFVGWVSLAKGLAESA